MMAAAVTRLAPSEDPHFDRSSVATTAHRAVSTRRCLRRGVLLEV